MTIALFGTGLLGSAIGHRLLQRGHALIVWNRSAERCSDLQKAGARLAGSDSDWLITVLSDGPTTAAVLLEQIGDGLAGRNVLQMGTIGVQESEALAAAVQQRGGRYLEAPALG
jgi:3-hydroxyisobutyrate dehydrogenase